MLGRGAGCELSEARGKSREKWRSQERLTCWPCGVVYLLSGCLGEGQSRGGQCKGSSSFRLEKKEFSVAQKGMGVPAQVFSTGLRAWPGCHPK